MASHTNSHPFSMGEKREEYLNKEIECRTNLKECCKEANHINI
jgi:hypothetical protein